jgi:hypothetical protein
MVTGRDPRPRHANGKPNEPSRGRFQFRLSTLFVVTAIVAVASAGLAKGSIRGAVVALLGAWTTLVGCLFVWGALARRRRMWFFGLLVGVGYLLLGAAMWTWAVF